MRNQLKFINEIIQKHKDKVRERNQICDDYLSQIDKALQDKDAIFAKQSSFIELAQAECWKKDNFGLFEKVSLQKIAKLKKAFHYKRLLAKQEELLNAQRTFVQQVAVHNNQVAEIKIPYARQLIGNVEGRELDKQQMKCIVKDFHNHLIVAGAGTGKTTTVVGKIKYLLKTGKYKPEDILVLSFTHDSAAEMSERINKETHYQIDAFTFHKLGVNIIAKVDGIMPKISNLSMHKFIKEQLEKNMQSEGYKNLFYTYLLFHRVAEKSEFEFSTKAEYDEYLEIHPPMTINQERVKSYGELDIANFLERNKIKYTYECPYEIDVRTSDNSQYKPDFYLPEYGIYIEYFGINERGEVPKYYKDADGHTATENYQMSMRWKRNTHKDNNTTLIECYAYQKWNGTMLDHLKKELEKYSVTFQAQTVEELWEKFGDNEPTVLEGVNRLFETLINQIKSNGYTIDIVKKMCASRSNAMANYIILSLIEPIYNAYNDYLSEHEEIDFNDMINKAAEYVQQGKYDSPYKYVIVDEYQDISKARFKLLENLRKSKDYDLFCVGDDWQSIYRFNGSDISYIYNFEKYWGSTEISKIETTYRFPQSLIEISSSFIMKNPMQLRKVMQGRQDDMGFSLEEIQGYQERYAINFMLNKLKDLPPSSSVFFIGRYSFDIEMLKENSNLDCHWNNAKNMLDVKYNLRPDLNMNFITAHKSKGLQADYVFIINNKKSRMGFPSRIEDAPILSLLLDNSDSYSFAEERRLFYVALTRAKKKVFLVTVKEQESIFALELITQYKEQMDKEKYSCPKCGGRLIKRKSQYGEFWGCSNYGSMGCKYKRNMIQKQG